ncbi:MAG: hypothetical protein JW894_07695 [Bacteroidales bacterium]|nr:hypothetical protein [Bacteroidales bacterium]
MRNRKKDWIVNSVLLIISIVIAIIIAEITFRLMLFSKNDAFDGLRDPSSYAIYVKHNNEDFYNNDYWKLNFLFSKIQNNVENPHPLLGWIRSCNHETLMHNNSDRLNNRIPVLLYGDSFADCLDTVKCFDEILNNDPEFNSKYYLLNYGAVGYGVDQIYLLFEHTHKLYEKPVVVFSLLTTDLDRSMLSFRDAQKSYFTITDGQLELKGTPIALTTEEFVKQNPPEITSYLFNRFRNSSLNPFKQRKCVEEEYIENIKELNKAVLEKTFARLEELNTDFLF